MNKNKNGFDGIMLIYLGFIILGSVVCWIYGFTANRFQPNEVLLLAFTGGVVGFSLGLICNGVISRFRK